MASVCGETTIVASPADGQCDSQFDRTAWVGESLKRIQAVKPGMSREQLMRVFTTEGGLVFSALQRTFVSRDCPFFKVDVIFRRASGSDAGQFEDLDGDVIEKISRPYLEFSIAD